MKCDYVVKPRAVQKIRSFYRNVAKKYRHTFSYEDVMKSVHDAVFSIYKIENGLQRRRPVLPRWDGYFMASANNWYFAYSIEDNKVIVVDACHAQNMHDGTKNIWEENDEDRVQ